MARSDFKFRFPFRVRYSEIDGQQIVFNAHYLTYYDTAITEYFRALPHDYKAVAEETGMDFHTVKSLVEYKKMITFDEEIDVWVRVGRIGRTSLRFDLEIHGKDQDDLRATGEIVWVHTCQKSHRPEPVPDDLRAKIVTLDGEGEG